MTQLQTNSRSRNTKDAADFLGVRKSTLDAWRYRGTGPRYVRLGRKIAYLDAFLLEFLEQSTVNPE
jgi:predicted DNA-binding transcriptional regulator AlpA